ASVAAAAATTTAKAPLPATILPTSTGAPVLYSYGDRRTDVAHRLGLGETPGLPLRSLSIGDGLSLEGHSPEEKAGFSVASAAPSGHDDVALSEEAAARSFVVGLLQRQQIDLGGATEYLTGAGRKHAGRTTHELVTEDGKKVLKRRYFACNCGAGFS